MKKSTVKIMIATAFVVLFWSVDAAFAQSGCSKTTNANIVAAIKAQFEADPEINLQMRHINISVKKRIVRLEGWLDGKVLTDKAVALAKSASCVKKVINLLKESGGGSCGAGQRPCGDSCIDRRSECMILN